jgi:hypothetical protein
MPFVEFVETQPGPSGRRSDRILAGTHAPRSPSHDTYIALETIKLGALLVTGVLLTT